MSSISTMTTFGAPGGAFTSTRGGGVTLRASIPVPALKGGSAIGSTVRSIAAGPGGACAGAAGFDPEHAAVTTNVPAAAAPSHVLNLITVLSTEACRPPRPRASS